MDETTARTEALRQALAYSIQNCLDTDTTIIVAEQFYLFLTSSAPSPDPLLKAA